MSLLLLLRTPSATIHALTGVASGQGVGTARLAVLRHMAGDASGQGVATGRLARVHPVAGLAAGGGTVSGALRVARAMRGIAAASGTLAARLAVVRKLAGEAAGLADVGAQLARVRPLAGEASGTSTSSGARRACAGWLASPLAGPASSGSCCCRLARQPAARCGSGGRRGPCRSHLKPGYTSCGARRASSCPPRRTGPSTARGEQGHRRMTFTKDPDAVLDYSVDWSCGWRATRSPRASGSWRRERPSRRSPTHSPPAERWSG